MAEALGLARTLRRLGHSATLVVPQATPPTPLPPHHLTGQTTTPAFSSQWRTEGFAVLPVGPAGLEPAAEHFPRDPSLAVARTLAPLLATFDVAWFFEAHWAAPMLRERRFRDHDLPVVVLHAQTEPYPILTTLDAINRVGSDQYARRWADRIFDDAGTENTGEAQIREVEALWRVRVAEPAKPMRAPATSQALTVCIPFFEEPTWLPVTLESFARQTSQDFTVVVVDDGSHSAEALAVFAQCAERYRERGWRFVHQTNQAAGAARNHAARLATTEFLLFFDADDFAMPTLVERFLRAALLTGDDCLVAPNYGFGEDPEGHPSLLYQPPGTLVGSIADDMHGGSCILVRRAIFEQMGGFSSTRGVGFEDYEFHVRCNLVPNRPHEPDHVAWDVLPEFVYRYRNPPAHSVSRSTRQYANHDAVLRWYRRKLQPLGLGALPLALAASYWRQENLTHQLAPLEGTRQAHLPRRGARGKDLKLLLLACNFPYGMVSGWHIRVQQMIRYLGSRHQVTLVTSMLREQLGPLRKETFEFLHAVRGIEGSDIEAATPGSDLPFRVRDHYKQTYRNALRALPTHRYHAAIFDQVFLAEFRHDIDTIPVLTEHNIESILLHQAAERSFSGDVPEAFRNALAEAARLTRYEDRVWPDFPLRAVVSEADKLRMDARIAAQSPVNPGRTVVTPNGADLANWLPNARFEAAALIFPAHLRYLPNIDAVEFFLTEVWPLVLARKPAARLILAGRDPAASVTDHASRARNVELVVNPPSMDKIAERASIVIVPVRLGSGTRTKILEGLAWGLPVVSTTLGAEGIDAADGEQILLADTAQAFAEAIVRLLSDKLLWERLRLAGRELIRERYSWDKVFQPLEEGLLELTS
jgi:glycosyltransferase involved in cell wall biosynthesis